MGTNTTTPIDESLRPVLEQVRKDLLDFGMRNPLLNYRLLKSKGAESVPLDPVPLFESLVTDGRELRFTAAQLASAADRQLILRDGGAAAQLNDAAWRRLPATQNTLWTPDRFADGQFVANHSQQDLDKRLLATYYAARTSIEELGVNTLFLAVGMLNWKDPAAPDDTHRAPLVLIPVELERQSASEGFRLRYTNDDVSPNVCLIEFLKQFNVRIDLPSEDEEFDLRRYFRRFSDAIPIESEWSLDTDSVVLGFFSFSKFLMYRDLDPAIWPTTSGLLNHDVLQRLLGASSFAGEYSTFSDSDFLDDLPSHTDQMHVMDADSTQTLALMDAGSGKSMVVQGPPGTGKSQTIVNLIALALAQGKNVLFVSEKRAALDVVKKRLDKCGLGNACLELHSNKAKKKEVIAELKRMMDLNVRDVPPKSSDRLALQDSRAKLNEYCRAVNLKFAPSGERTLDLFGLILPVLERLAGKEIPQLNLPDALEWSEIHVEQKRSLVEKLQSFLGRVGVPERHVFWGSQLRVVLPATQERARQAMLQAGGATRQCRDAVHQLAALVGTNVPSTPDQGAGLSRIAQALLSAPVIVDLDLQNLSWRNKTKEIGEALDAGKTLAQIRANWSGKLSAEAWSTDVSELHADLMRLRSKWWRFASPEWYGVKRHCGTLVVGKRPNRPHEMIEVTCAIREAAMCGESINRHRGLLAELFRSYWRDEQSNWAMLRAQFDWISDALSGQKSSAIPEWALQFITRCEDRSRLKEAIAETQLSCRELEAKRKSILDLFKCGESTSFAAATTLDQPFESLDTAWRKFSESVGSLTALVSFMQMRDECCSANLIEVADLADGWEDGAEHLLDVFQYWRLSRLIERAFDQSPILASFDQASHSEAAKLFRQLDAESLIWARSAIAKGHCDSIPTPSTANGQLGYLRMMFERRSRHPAIRKLIENAGNAIQAFKPVFMMSPLSVANFVPPESLRFDIVVFDEASQVRPADALGAIARGRQTIVVGDSKQLPPTSFFDSLSNGEEDEDAPDGPATDIESVLGLFCARSAHQRMLRWHYRSRHESLIAGSNHLFYDDRLVVFPSSEKRRDNLGLIYHRVPNAPYDRSRTRTNPVEALAVAEAVMNFAAEQLQLAPDFRLTLGVATFSVAQRDAVLDQLEILRRARPDSEEFFSGPPHEPFFVKNLENVQGDERDAIFISVGYGRTKEGYLSMGFGPVNRNGGERRLNVLFSRARRRCEVFTTLSADDIDVGQNPTGGLRALKSFLHYAERGQLDIPAVTGRGPDSPFEEEVGRTLRRLGYAVETQVGSAGFFIDIAVLDDAMPGRYLIGIECDGAAYHTARSARDRDRLRQAVLEDLGWQLHRIWSTAWFRERDREIDRLVAAIEAAKLRQNAPQPQVEPTERGDDDADEHVAVGEQVEVARPQAIKHQREMPKYQICRMLIDLRGTELHLISTATLIDWLVRVVESEGPIHWLEAARRVANGAGVQRVGGRIQDSIERACKVGSRSGKFIADGDFLKSVTQGQCPIRDRSDLPGQMKRLSLVAPDEIDAAIEFVTGESFGIGFDDAAMAACRLLGFARVTDEMQTIAEKRRDVLLARGRLEQRGEMLFLCQTSVGQ